MFIGFLNPAKGQRVFGSNAGIRTDVVLFLPDGPAVFASK